MIFFFKNYVNSSTWNFQRSKVISLKGLCTKMENEVTLSETKKWLTSYIFCTCSFWKVVASRINARYWRAWRLWLRTPQNLSKANAKWRPLKQNTLKMVCAWSGSENTDVGSKSPSPIAGETHAIHIWPGYVDQCHFFERTVRKVLHPPSVAKAYDKQWISMCISLVQTGGFRRWAWRIFGPMCLLHQRSKVQPECIDNGIRGPGWLTGSENSHRQGSESGIQNNTLIEMLYVDQFWVSSWENRITNKEYFRSLVQISGSVRVHGVMHCWLGRNSCVHLRYSSRVFIAHIMSRMNYNSVIWRSFDRRLFGFLVITLKQIHFIGVHSLHYSDWRHGLHPHAQIAAKKYLLRFASYLWCWPSRCCLCRRPTSQPLKVSKLKWISSSAYPQVGVIFSLFVIAGIQQNSAQ